MWFMRRMLRIPWTPKEIIKDCLEIANDRRKLYTTLRGRQLYITLKGRQTSFFSQEGRYRRGPWRLEKSTVEAAEV